MEGHSTKIIEENSTNETLDVNNTEEENDTNKTIVSNNNNNKERYDFNVTNVEEIDRIDAVVDFRVLLQLLGIGIALTLLSSLASMIAISRFSPLTILKERS